MDWPSLTTSPSWSFSVSSFAQRGQMTRSNILVEQKRNFLSILRATFPQTSTGKLNKICCHAPFPPLPPPLILMIGSISISRCHLHDLICLLFLLDPRSLFQQEKGIDRQPRCVKRGLRSFDSVLYGGASMI